MTKGELAESLFRNGYNCSQSVAVAFSEETGLDKELISHLALGFGGGMGRMREVCGAVSAMTLVLSAVYVNDDRAKMYERVQYVSNRFKEETGSIVCRELLGLNTKGADDPTPEKRTQEYYKKRPCPKIVHLCADILEEYLKLNQL